MAIIYSKKQLELPIEKINNKQRHKDLVVLGVKLMKRKKLPIEWKWSHEAQDRIDENGNKVKVWNNSKGKIGKISPIFAEPQNMTGIIPDCIGWSYTNSVVIEAKTNRVDFLNDTRKKNMISGGWNQPCKWDGTRGKKAFIGVYFFYLSYPGIIKPEELTWQGLIEYNPETKRVEYIKAAKARHEDYGCESTEIAILLSGMRGTNRRVD